MEREINAPVPGKIVSIKCNEGQEVRKGDVLLILETMKMENEIYAPSNGLIKKILVKEGDFIQHGKTMIIIEIKEE
ncbi:MAG: acetyl-CoA carboxylase biotin carboxyl carrier protein subunit [Nitrososphaerota archaeon]